MHTLPLRCRLLGGILAVGLAMLALAGCSDVSQPTTGSSLSVLATVADPTTPTTDDYSLAAVKPDNPADAVAVLAAPVLSSFDGAAVTSSGANPRLLVTCGDSGASGGSLPLAQHAGRMMSDEFAVLPQGNSTISLSPDSLIDVGDVAVGHPMRLSDFSVQFSVHGGHPPTWTLPTTHKLRMERHRRMYVLKGSFLELSWNGHHSVPPTDNKVTITADLYNGATKVAGPLTKTVPIVNNTATFTSNTNVEFDRVAIAIDLRDAK